MMVLFNRNLFFQESHFQVNHVSFRVVFFVINLELYELYQIVFSRIEGM